MALVVYDRVLQTGTANTTVSFSLSGTVTGYQSFAVVGNTNTTYYSATDGTNWETGLGTYASSGTVLTRTTVLQSSNSNAAVTFSGTVTVWIDYTASKSVYQDANGTATSPQLATSSSTSTTPTLSFNAANSAYAAGATVASSYLQFLMQNKSATAGASTNYVLSNDLGTDSTYYGEFGMNSSVYSASTPADFFSINNGVYFSGHDGDITVGSGNGFKNYFAWGTTGQSAHVINASGAIGLSTNLGTTPALSGTTGFGTSGQPMLSGGSSAAPTWGTLSVGGGGSGAVSLSGYLFGNGTSAFTAVATIPNAGLTNSSVTLGSTAVSLGTTVATFAGVTLSSPTFVTPVLGTPSSGTLSSCSGYNSNSLSGVTLASTVLVSSLTSFGTSPTFVTPILGTPTSGTLTNCSGYNSNSLSGVTLASTVVTSSLTSVGTIGTGTWSASFGAVSGANLTSLTGANVTGTVANATAAVTFSSTSQNSQFNSIGVGTAGSTTAGEIRATNNVTAYYSSDRTLKENIQDIPNALEIAVAIGSKTFDWTDAYLEAHGGEDGYFVQKSDFGVIAQDVQKVFPIAVRTREDGTLAVDYEKLGTLAFAALNQLLKRVEALEAK